MKSSSPSNTRANSPDRPSSPNNRKSEPGLLKTLGSPVKDVPFKYKKNAKGGVLVTPEDIQTAFHLLDLDKSGLSLPVLKKRLSVLFPDFTSKDYKFLMNNKKEITMDDLTELLIDNEITNFDPVAEAFKVFDPANEGSVDGEKLRQAFIAYGFGDLTNEEYEILLKAADGDCDGIISLDDFRSMLESSSRRDKKTPKN